MEFSRDGRPPSGPADWSAIKAGIVGALDVPAEFEALGVAFVDASPDDSGKRRCHAIGRVDATPSAFVNVRTAYYWDSGGDNDHGHLFDVALKHGKFGRWLDVLKHYADKAGVDVSGIRPGRKGRIVESRYVYTNAGGKPEYVAVRYKYPNGKKDFSQHPIGPDGRAVYGDGKMDAVVPLPYRLPDLVRSAEAGDPVFVVEGEKVADRLWSEGVAATTCHGGSSATARWGEIREWLRGRDVYVFPDNDAPGERHAAGTAALLFGVARTVRVVRIDGLPKKGDIHDYLDMGGTIEALCYLAEKAPVWTSASGPDAADGVAAEGAAPARKRSATAAHIRAALADVGWLWPGWIGRGELTLLAAEPGTGKTRFVFDLQRRIANGLPWPDGAEMTLPPDAKFLWVAADNQWREIGYIPIEFGIPDDSVVVNAPEDDPFSGAMLEDAEDLEDLEARIEDEKPAVVVIDTITNTGDYQAQDARDARRQYKPLQEIATKYQIAIICVTHLNVSGKVLGRRAVDKCRVVIQLDRPDPEGQPNRRKLYVPKSRALPPPPLGVTMGADGNEYDGSPPSAPSASAGRPSQAVESCKDWLRGQLCGGPRAVVDLRNAADEAGIAAGTLYRARDSLGVSETKSDVSRRLMWSLTAANGEHQS